MADRLVEEVEQEIPEIPEILEQVLLYCLDEAKKRLLEQGELVPFTAVAVKEDLFIETHPAESTEECFALARHTVEGVRGASAYAFCYDGYLDTDEGQIDALIAEGGVPADENGFAVCLMYETDADGQCLLDEEPAYVGHAPNFMSALVPFPADDDPVWEEWEQEEEAADEQEAAE